METAFLVKALASLFAIVNPLGALPLFLALAPAGDPAALRRAARRAVMAASICLVVIFAVGQGLLNFFGITIPAFRVSGGILILIMALQMLEGHPSRQKLSPRDEEAARERDEAAIVPLGIPMLAGPGAISTTILLRQEAEGVVQAASVVVAAALVMVATAAVLLSADRIHRLLGESGIRIVTRVMGLVIAAVAVQFMADGLRGLFPVLAGLSPFSPGPPDG